jgi:hypothetical protein
MDLFLYLVEKEVGFKNFKMGRKYKQKKAGKIL